MSYATYNDMVLRYPSASKWADTPMQVNSSFIYYAENELNGLLAPVFEVPFTSPIPITIADLTIDLAYARRWFVQDAEKAKPFRDAVYARIQNIVDGLESILTSSGTIITALDSTGGKTIWSSTMDYPPVNTMLDAENEHTMISSEMLYAEEELR